MPDVFRLPQFFGDIFHVWINTVAYVRRFSRFTDSQRPLVVNLNNCCFEKSLSDKNMEKKLKRQMTPISIHRLKSKKILWLLCRFRGMKLGDYIASFTEELSWFTRNFFQRMIWQRSSVFIWALALRGLWRRWSFTSTAWAHLVLFSINCLTASSFSLSFTTHSLTLIIVVKWSGVLLLVVLMRLWLFQVRFFSFIFWAKYSYFK